MFVIFENEVPAGYRKRWDYNIFILKNKIDITCMYTHKYETNVLTCFHWCQFSKMIVSGVPKCRIHVDAQPK